MTDYPIFYRYWDTGSYDYPSIELKEYVAYRETTCGHWIIPKTEAYWLLDTPYAKQPHVQRILKKTRRWINKTTRKRFAYPTLEEAWESYKHRKRHHLAHVEAEHKALVTRLTIIEKFNKAPDVEAIRKLEPTLPLFDCED